MPPFRFLLSADHTPVAPGTPLWEAPLPTSRGAAGGGAPASEDGAPISCGAYFSALEEALAADDCAVICEAMAGITQPSPGAPRTPKGADRLDRVEIQLLKHGHFYHPARLVVHADGVAHPLALNAALSPDGIAQLPKETAALDALASQAGLDSVPRVLAQGDCISPDGRGWRWFLAPWFEGFHEFHLTRVGDGGQAVVVWNGAADTDPTLLDAAQTDALLEGAARILTTAFNPHTLAHIFPWHHAAGDFVLRLGADGRPRVRLITVRDYQPLLPPAEDNGEEDAFLERLLYALLLLVVQAALRLRVDRLDGVGEVAVHPPRVVAAICRGFRDGITAMCQRWGLPVDLELPVMAYLGTPSLDDLSQLSAAVYGGFALESPERQAFAPYFDAHVKVLHARLQDMG